MAEASCHGSMQRVAPLKWYKPSADLSAADIKGANQKQRNERLNRSAQNFLYACIGGEGEAAAKPALAVLTELWRRHVWRDARTANVIGGRIAVCHAC